jgi:UDP-N-acetylglucosamine transferase subunit ALG13
MIIKMLGNIPKILKGIKEEYKQLDEIIDDYKIDTVISDNRYGCWNKKVKSILITHQLMVKSPFFEKFLHKKILSYVRNFDECWIPDVEGENNLSGDLSHKYSVPENCYFIGPLSRFANHPTSPQPEQQYDIMAIISGPEPQRSIFEKMVIEQLESSSFKSLVVCGKTNNSKTINQKKNIKIVSHLNAEDMENAIRRSGIILCRSGYSSIMDLAYLGKKAIFVPTPGQTEQEYLAELLMQRRVAYAQSQSSFHLKATLNKSKEYKGFQNTTTTHGSKSLNDLLFRAINRI